MENKQYKDSMNKTEQIIKRSVDFVIATCCLIFFSPLAIACAIAIRLEDGLPVIYRQERIGLHGTPFRIHKFRSMSVNTEKSSRLTIGNDARITKAGHFIRKYNFDELPQLIDVLIGSMSLVGPRPEVAEFMNRYDPITREKILSVRPGITDWASIQMIDENEILGQYDNPKQAYIDIIMPMKSEYYISYAESHTFHEDLKIIFATIFKILD